ncbi:MAG: hemerythrin family protein [Sphingomonadales bacterium]|nr:hemerythrin family protein [Sphingomonadales bacterium]
MTLLSWNETYSTGSPAVDHEHQHLIALINELHAEMKAQGGKDVVMAFLGEIYAKIASHFALEEQQMRAMNYAGYDEHKADHERLLDEIRDIMDAYEEGEGGDVDEVLASRLSTWFGRHFSTIDARLHSALGH